MARVMGSVTDFRPIFFVIGVLLTTIAIAMLLPAIADGLKGNPDWKVFLASSAFTLFIGACLILVAYGLNQRGRLTPDRAAYSVLNLVGGLLLLWVAVVDRRAGFVVVEGAWSVMSLIPLVRRGPKARSRAMG